MNRTVSDVPLPRLRDPDALSRAVLSGCLRDTVFASRAQQWCRANPKYDRMDYLWHVTKPYRDAGSMPDFPNVASYVAWVLALPADLAQG